MASLRRRLSVAVGFGETHFACLKRLCTRWHRIAEERFRRFSRYVDSEVSAQRREFLLRAAKRAQLVYRGSNR